MIDILLNTIALDPNRWTPEKIAFFKLKSVLEPIARSGFDALEVWQYHLVRETEAAVKKIARQADELGLRMPIIGAYPKLHLAGAAGQAEMDSMAKLLDYGNMLNTRVMKIWLGAIGSKAIAEDERERSYESLARIIEMAAQHGITITGENHDNTLLDSLEACERVFELHFAANLKVCYQPYDFTSTEKAVADYRALADRVVHIHFQGRRNGQFEWLEMAEVNYVDLVAAMADCAFQGYWCIEFVKNCVVQQPQDLDLALVLDNATRGRRYLESLRAESFGN